MMSLKNTAKYNPEPYVMAQVEPGKHLALLKVSAKEEGKKHWSNDNHCYQFIFLWGQREVLTELGVSHQNHTSQ